MPKKKVKAVPPTAETPVENPRFENSDSYRRLAAEIERRRAAGLLREREPQYFSRGPKQVGSLISPWLEELRKRHGITEADMERAASEIAQEPHETPQERRRKAREARWAEICPPLFAAQFDWSKLPSTTKRDGVQEVLDWKFGPRGLFVVGDTGLAKTTTVYAMLREQFIQGRSVKVYDGIQFAVECSVAFRESGQTEAWLKAALEPDIFVIDDLAKRFTEATQQGFFAVLDRRTTHLRPLIITSNCSGETLEGMVKDRQLAGPMRRRMKQHLEPVVF